ncbi:MAG: heme-binding protein [Stellaceae bacterium]
MSGRPPRLFTHPAFRAAMAVLSVWCMAPGGCGGGSGSGVSTSGVSTTAPTNPAAPVGGTSPNLTEADVNTIMLQAVNEATARGKPATIAVVDRVGNVLSLTQMPGAPGMATITSGLGNNTGLENVSVPTSLAAIAKALTGAYLSSNGNAFSTRTANYIIQQHFAPTVTDAPGGPLFGVQFSQLPCSDFNTAASGVAGATNAGPHRSPLGFSADAGGLPVYKNGILAGGIGVMTETTYSDNLNALTSVGSAGSFDDEVIALAGSTGYQAPPALDAENIAVNGLTLQYTDATSANFAAPVSATGTFTPLPLAGFFAGPAPGHTAIAGLTYGSADGASGVAPDGALGPMLYPGTTNTSYVFTDGAGHVLYAPTNGLVPVGQAITAAEAQALMTSALNVAYSARAAIRIPTNSFAQVTVTIVDLDGNIVAQARTPDAPVFGADVSRQKARTAVFFSRTDAAAKVSAITAPASNTSGTFAQYITDSRALTGDSNAFADGLAWSEVSIGDIARPFYPDGIDGNPPGSLSLPINLWSVFSTGIQLDLIKQDFVNALTGVATPAAGCGTSNGKGLPPTASGGKTPLADGMQIFSGGAPLYRGNTLVGGIGVSGDGIQQDSLISFAGLQNFVDPQAGTPISNAPTNIRSDLLAPGGVNLRYVNCPAAPFLNSTVQNPC